MRAFAVLYQFTCTDTVLYIEHDNTGLSTVDFNSNNKNNDLFYCCFTRVTLYVLAVFAVARVCLSVSLSRWLIVSTRLKNSITLVFDPQCRYTIPREPFSGGVK